MSACGTGRHELGLVYESCVLLCYLLRGTSQSNAHVSHTMLRQHSHEIL